MSTNRSAYILTGPTGPTGLFETVNVVSSGATGLFETVNRLTSFIGPTGTFPTLIGVTGASGAGFRSIIIGGSPDGGHLLLTDGVSLLLLANGTDKLLLAG